MLSSLSLLPFTVDLAVLEVQIVVCDLEAAASIPWDITLSGSCCFFGRMCCWVGKWPWPRVHGQDVVIAASPLGARGERQERNRGRKVRIICYPPEKCSRQCLNGKAVSIKSTLPLEE